MGWISRAVGDAKNAYIQKNYHFQGLTGLLTKSEVFFIIVSIIALRLRYSNSGVTFHEVRGNENSRIASTLSDLVV
jgi:hypothetical protein